MLYTWQTFKVLSDHYYLSDLDFETGVNVCVAVMSLILCLLSYCSAKSKWHVVLLQGNPWHTASHIQQHVDVGIISELHESVPYKCSYFKRGCDTAAYSLYGHQFFIFFFSISSLICFGTQLLSVFEFMNLYGFIWLIHEVYFIGFIQYC